MDTYIQSKLDAIKKKAVPVLKDAGVSRSSIFGSFVHGDEKENSDIDLLVELPRGMSLFDFVGLQQSLEEVLKRPVDLGEYKAIKPQLKEYILNDAVQIL